ncbi:hypothetical protein AAZX31_16G009700 [Glycine max]
MRIPSIVYEIVPISRMCMRFYHRSTFLVQDILTWIKSQDSGAWGTCIASMWWIWKWRNNRIFNDDKWNLQHVLREWITGFFYFDGSGDSTEAEILALIHGLKGLHPLCCEMDAKFLVEIFHFRELSLAAPPRGAYCLIPFV